MIYFKNLNFMDHGLRLFFAVFLVASGLGCSVDSRKGQGPTLGNQADFEKVPGTNFRVDSLAVASTVNSFMNSYGLVGAKTINLRACIKDQSGNAVLPDQIFSIGDGIGGTVTCQKNSWNPNGFCKTDFNGCLNWSETHQFDILSDEGYYDFTREFAPVGVYKGKVIATVAFNPWADGAAAVIDPRFNSLPGSVSPKKMGAISVSGDKFVGSEKPNISVAINSASFEFTGFDYPNYEVDQLLDLTVAHNYIIRIKPLITRKAISSPLLAVSLMTGRMKVSIALLKDTADQTKLFSPNNVITTTDFIGTITSLGEVVASASIKFDNVANITSRSQMLVTLTPLDELARLGEFSFIGFMKPGVLQPVSLQPTRQSALDVMQKVKLAETQDLTNKLSPLERFAKDRRSGFVPMDLGAVRIPSLVMVPYGQEVSVKELMEQSFSSPLSAFQQNLLAQALCIKIFGDWNSGGTKISAERAEVARACFRRPEQFIRFDKRDFVEKLNSNRPKRVGITKVETFSMGVSLSRSESDSTSRGHSDSAKFGISASLGLDLTAPGIFSPASGAAGPLAASLGVPSIGLRASMGRDYFYTKAVSASTVNGTTVSAATSFTVSAEGNSFEIDVTSRPCFLVLPTYQATVLLGRVAEMASGAYYCSPKTRQQKRTETYYLLAQSVGVAGSPFSDSASAGEVRWRMFMRGQDSLSLFQKVVADKNLSLVLERIPDTEVETMFKSAYTNQEYPGLLSRP